MSRHHGNIQLHPSLPRMIPVGVWGGRTPRIFVVVRLDLVVGHVFIILILILDVVSAAMKATRDVPVFWDGATPLASG